MTTYQGHRNRNHWNVALWIANDYGLYQAALEAIRAHRTRDEAARALLKQLPRRTPDGIPYSYTTVRAALRKAKARNSTSTKGQ